MRALCRWVRLIAMTTSVKANSCWSSVGPQNLLVIPIWRTFYLLSLAHRNSITIFVNNNYRDINWAFIGIRICIAAILRVPVTHGVTSRLTGIIDSFGCIPYRIDYSFTHPDIAAQTIAPVPTPTGIATCRPRGSMQLTGFPFA